MPHPAISGLPTYPNRPSDVSASLLLRIKVPKSEERTNKERRRNEQKGSEKAGKAGKRIEGFFQCLERGNKEKGRWK
jgi:hypothetical protein